jgi:hypothetical protein
VLAQRVALAGQPFAGYRFKESQSHEEVVRVPRWSGSVFVLGAASLQMTLILLGTDQPPALGTDGHHNNYRAGLDTHCRYVLNVVSSTTPMSAGQSKGDHTSV